MTSTNQKPKAVDTATKTVELASSRDESTEKETDHSRRRSWLLTSFICSVVLPVILVALYYSFIATDRYAAKAGFSIRGIEANASFDGLGALTGLASAGSTTADSYIVLDYLKNRALVEELEQSVSLKSAFSESSIDRLSRLSTDATIEDFVDYWQSRLSIQFDPSSGIIEATVQSFSPEHAVLIAQQVLSSTQQLVNELSANARQDSLKFAKDEVTLQEKRLRKALNDIRDFRMTEQSVDPSATAALNIELLANLESRLIDINAKIAAQRETLDENAPSLVALGRQAQALANQINEQRNEISGTLRTSDSGDSSAVTEQLSRFETLDVERRFAEQAYASALSSLEQARRDANRQQRYLAIHLHPQAAEESEYPRRLRNVSVVAFALFTAWGIVSLIGYSVRDHLT